MNEDAKEISELILRKLSKINGNTIPSPDNKVILIYTEKTDDVVMKLEKFGCEISMVDKHHAFRFNFGSDEESMNKVWESILNNLNFKNL